MQSQANILIKKIFDKENSKQGPQFKVGDHVKT